MSESLGRFLLDEDEHGARLRVRAFDSFPLVRGLALVAFASIVFFPLSPLLIFIAWAAPTIALLSTGLLDGKRRAVQRSAYPRVRRLVELHRPHAIDQPFRAGSGLTISVDGRSLPGADFIGVVVATSVETNVMRYNFTTTIVRIFRYAPTLVFRDQLYELDVFEGADETDAHELADRAAAAFSGTSSKAPSVPWKPTRWVSESNAVIMSLLFLAADATATVSATAEARRTLTWTALGAMLVVSLLSALVSARLGARERSAAARRLREDALHALGHATHAVFDKHH